MDRRGRVSMIAWGGFIAFVLGILAVDLGVLNRRAHRPTIREALTFAGVTAALAAGFALFLHQAYDHHWLGLGFAPDALRGRPLGGSEAAITFVTGYVVELSLSLDNVFVIAVIFAHLRVPQVNQHRVLFWGVLGALLMRGAMIVGGTALLARYQWVTYLLGAFLVITGARMLFVGESAEEEPEERWLVKWLHRHFRVTRDFRGDHFTVLVDGARWLTPLAVALALVETTDLVFAVDSIPAVFAVTTDPFLVFTSNVFAILCLRSLYFGLAHLIERFRYLHASLAVILAIIGVKMLAASYTSRVLGDREGIVTLMVVIVCLAVGAAASRLRPAR